jgi:hypothetical protein
MRTRNILLASLLIALYGYQPDILNADWQLADKTGCYVPQDGKVLSRRESVAGATGTTRIPSAR